MSWILSCHQLKKFYPNIELVTDEEGYELLINKLELPYSNVRVELNQLDDYHSDLWALGKIYAYGVQDEPFLHVDGDVFIWDHFPDTFKNAKLIAQNQDKDEPGYAEVYNYVFKNFDFIPKEIPTRNGAIFSVNAGVFGGADLTFFKDYTSLVFEFVDRNLNRMEGLNRGAFNMFYEQLLFYCMAKDRQKKIEFLVDDERLLLDKHVNFAGIPSNSNYLHSVGSFKRRKETGKFLEYTIKNYYPERYYHLMDLLRQNKI